MTPQEIEALSFKIIDEEAGPHGFSDRQWRVVRRMIHTTGDFEYIQSVRFHPDAVSAGMAAIQAGKPIFTDTKMAQSGIRKTEISRFGGTVECLIDDPQVVKTAAKSGETRAKTAVDVAAGRMTGGICVVGNAPTALLRLLELIAEGKTDPALIIGIPVGFVNAAESKAALAKSDRPFITNVGRKGGSALAASIFNALALMAVR